jgi:hypothetical protein
MEYKKFAIFLKLGFDEMPDDKSLQYKMPIDSMYGISVYTKVEIEKNGYMRFTIDAWEVYDTIGGDRDTRGMFRLMRKFDKITLKNIETFTKELFETIPNLTYNILNGSFCVKPKVDVDLVEMFQCFQKLDFIKMAYDECCVCKENTQVKTHCGHTLCVGCWDKIKYSCSGCSNGCDGCFYKKCPICREDL